MLPANMFGETTSSCSPCLMRSPCSRSIGSACFHAAVPCFRYDTSTDALRLSSPWMNHSKPRLINVGGSTRNSPAVTAPPGVAAVITRCRNQTPLTIVTTTVSASVRSAAVFMGVPFSKRSHLMRHWRSMPRWFLAPSCAAAIALSAFSPAPAAQTPPVRGIYNWIHGTRDAERAFAFYHDVFGITLGGSPFGAAPAGAPPETIRPASQAGSDPLVWALTNTHGS